ncbi:hypothetical protein G6514_000114 [Epicoccum nigrum]|nr:hypothetical protein G6514_000114 [Epicoccum nigrum]
MAEHDRPRKVGGRGQATWLPVWPEVPRGRAQGGPVQSKASEERQQSQEEDAQEKRLRWSVQPGNRRRLTSSRAATHRQRVGAMRLVQGRCENHRPAVRLHAPAVGEYVGELVSGRSVDVDTSYLLSVADDAGAEEVCIDSLRVGEWTRFVNHSCRASTYFENRRVEDEARVVLVTEREVRSGEEVTVDYGKAYWATMNRKGVWCVCGEEGCRFSERVGRRRVERRVRRREAR